MSCKFYYEGEDKITSFISKNYSIYFLADGHGGDFVSSYLKNNFINYFKKYFNLNSSNIQQVIKSTISDIDTRLKQYNEGSTLVGFVINNDTFTVFNVGDSRCYVIDNDNKINKITNDHNLYNQNEIKRLNYQVDLKDTDRRLDGKLAMTRSIGDNDINGRISTPSLKTLNINNYKYIILCSDGTYTSMTDNILKDLIITNKSMTKAVDQIIDYAKQHGDGDDISILIKKISLQQV